jgi:hypothetical protein
MIASPRAADLEVGSSEPENLYALLQPKERADQLAKAQQKAPRPKVKFDRTARHAGFRRAEPRRCARCRRGANRCIACGASPGRALRPGALRKGGGIDASVIPASSRHPIVSLHA